MDYISDNNLEKNTLIIFISDNGGAEYTHTTDNGRYEGGKNTEFEGGLKVPMIIRWTGTLTAGQRFKPVVSSMDIFPTTIASTQSELAYERELDGVNLLPFLIDSIQNLPHPYLFWQRGISKVVRTNKWKSMMNDKSEKNLLYNLITNKYVYPDESSTFPEVVERLKKAHFDWTQIHKEPMWPPVIYFTSKKDGTKYYFEQ